MTPRPQDGNPRPRLFRLAEDRGVINRMGFQQCQGLDAARSRLAIRPRRGFVGVNVGANKDSTDRAADYVACSVALAPYADYLACNVSSPNTPGLRDLQGPRSCSAACRGACRAPLSAGRYRPWSRSRSDASDERPPTTSSPPAARPRLDGIIVGNTTLPRPSRLALAAARRPAGRPRAPLEPLSDRRAPPFRDGAPSPSSP